MPSSSLGVNQIVPYTVMRQHHFTSTMSGLHTHYSEATVPLDKKEGADYNWRCVKPADDLFYRELGRRIRALRTEHGLTQAGLGLRLEPPVTRAAIANVENGKQRVLAHTLVQLAQIFRVEIK